LRFSFFIERNLPEKEILKKPRDERGF